MNINYTTKIYVYDHQIIMEQKDQAMIDIIVNVLRFQMTTCRGKHREAEGLILRLAMHTTINQIDI